MLMTERFNDGTKQGRISVYQKDQKGWRLRGHQMRERSVPGEGAGSWILFDSPLERHYVTGKIERGNKRQTESNLWFLRFPRQSLATASSSCHRLMCAIGWRHLRARNRRSRQTRQPQNLASRFTYTQAFISYKASLLTLSRWQKGFSPQVK